VGEAIKPTNDAPVESKMGESFENFAARVFARTGVKIDKIEVVDEKEILGGHILARHKETTVIFVGYPSHEDGDGTPFWPPSAVRKVITR
jgi:hypothetical protein